MLKVNFVSKVLYFVLHQQMYFMILISNFRIFNSNYLTTLIQFVFVCCLFEDVWPKLVLERNKYKFE